MKIRQTLLAGWSLGLIAVIGATVSFPAIADKALEQREDIVWSEKAAEYASFGKQGQEPKAILKLRSDANSIRPLTKAQPQLAKLAEFTMDQKTCLAEAVYYEARSETRSGQIGVAEVVMNRVTSKHYPSSICEVVYQGSERQTGCQFSFTCDGSMDLTPKGEAWARSQDIATLVLTGMAPKLTGKATHYHTTDVNPPWASTLRYNGQIGSHKFYRFKWRERNVTPVSSIMIAPPI